MSQAEKLAVLLSDLCPYRSRKTKLRKIGTKAHYDEWYSWLVNDWIPSQPDSNVLMRLFISVGLDPLPFIRAVVTGRIT